MSNPQFLLIIGATLFTIIILSMAITLLLAWREADKADDEIKQTNKKLTGNLNGKG